INTLCGLLVSQFCVDFRVLLYCSGQYQRKSDNGSFFRFPFSIIKTKNGKWVVSLFWFSHFKTKIRWPQSTQTHNKSFSLPLSLCVCVRVFFFCKTSVKIGCFGLATTISELCVLSTMVRLQMFNQIACVKQSTFLSAPPHRSSADLTLCFTPVVVIYLKMSPNRR